MLNLKENDITQVWKAVKETRKEMLITTTEPECKQDDMLLSDYNIRNNVKNVCEKLNLHKNATKSSTVKPTRKLLETAAQMFTYLNYCPLFTSLYFYEDLFKTATPKDILLALTNVIKSSQNADNISSNKIFTKVMDMFKLILYKDIDYVTKKENMKMEKNNISSFEILKALGLTI